MGRDGRAMDNYESVVLDPDGNRIEVAAER
jgi:hypothetical protein